MQLTTCPYPVLGLACSLKRLNLNGNQLEVLPDEIGNLADLTHLSVTANKLTHLPT